MKNLYIALIFACFGFGCAVEAAEEDGFQIESQEGHQCWQVLLNTDPWNCGACGNVCSPSDADGCFEGRCSCGENPYGNGQELCRQGSDCRFDRCIKTDSSGDICEMEDECGEGWGCIEGRCTLVCVPEQGKLACNGLDDDCDGCVDATLNEDVCIHEQAEKFDIVFGIDVSGSMEGLDIRMVKEAVHRSAERFSGDDSFRFGAVLIPSYDVDGRPEMYSDLTDFDTFDARLSSVESVHQGDEPTYDAVYELGAGELPMSWRAGSTRVIIVFTDEEGQSYRREFGLSSVGETEMCSVLTHGEVLVFVTKAEFYRNYNECAMVIELTSDVEVLKNIIGGAVSDPCH